MNVCLLQHTHLPEELVWQAARTCYSAGPPTQLKVVSRDKKADLIRRVLKSGHLSVLEHVNFSFAIEGVSRILSHQLVRHRLASYSQQSQRYVKADNPEYVMPDSIEQDTAMQWVYERHMIACWNLYAEFVKNGIPAEDARFVLPNAAQTHLVMSMNARELLHFFEKRCCKRAQWEIREMAERMLTLCKTAAPVLFENAGAPCVSKGVCKEVDTCGMPTKK